MFLAAFALDPIANSIAVVVLLLMIISVLFVAVSFINGKTDSRLYRWPRFSIPVLSIIGLGVALYLSFVEITQTQALCGPIGDCNRVQQSSFATLFGIIPVGLLGAAGYIATFVAWLIKEYGPQTLRKLSTLGIWAMAWFGMAFSIYLTFLEPFVIGATCAWCITSALVMMMIFWASTKPAIDSLQVEEIADFDLADDEETHAD